MKATYRAVNVALKKIGAAERLVKGNGYSYFTDGEAHNWSQSAVYVNAVSQFSVERWIEEYRSLKAAHEATKGE